MLLWITNNKWEYGIDFAQRISKLLKEYAFFSLKYKKESSFAEWFCSDNVKSVTSCNYQQQKNLFCIRSAFWHNTEQGFQEQNL
jgi:hypothetical protein